MVSRVDALRKAFEEGKVSPELYTETENGIGNNKAEGGKHAPGKDNTQVVQLRRNSRGRTRIGSPKIRESFTTEDLDLFNAVNDGFPLPLNYSANQESDDVFTTVPGPVPSPALDKNRRRSRSLPDIQRNKVKVKPKIARKPNFLQKLFQSKKQKIINSDDKKKDAVAQLLSVNPTKTVSTPSNARLSDIQEEKRRKSSSSLKEELSPQNKNSQDKEISTQMEHLSNSTTGDNGTNQAVLGNNNNINQTERNSDSSGSARDSDISTDKSTNFNFSCDNVYDNTVKKGHVYENIDDSSPVPQVANVTNVYENMEFGFKTNDPKKYSSGISHILEFDNSWDSDSFSDSFSDYSDSEESTGIQKSRSVQDLSPETKCHKVACEMLSTECAYVDKLQLLDQVFHFRIDMENRANPMFSQDVVSQMFSNINSLYHLHKEFFLQPLEARLSTWADDQRIGDIMLKIGPFLKMYTEYIKNFDQSMHLIDLHMEKSKRFSSLLEEIQKLPECGLLTLQHHMLGPIQRVPRYELLLKDYLKHLPEDSKDRKDAEKALEQVTIAASHANEAMRKIDKFRKLLEINEKLGNSVNLITPTRELIKEGAIKKVSARSGDLQDRYIYLFSDVLLLCSVQFGVGKPSYKIKAKLDVDAMEARNGDDLDLPNTFHVKSRQKSLSLLAETLEESSEWQVAIWRCVSELARRRESFQSLQPDYTIADDELGKRAPTWIRDSAVSMCMLCQASFSTFKRRHHCRACGTVVCGNCSNRKFSLRYDNNKMNRVCKKCIKILSQQVNSQHNTDDELDLSETDQKKKIGVLKVKANDPCVISGYLWISSNRGRNWEKKWFSVHDNFVLYTFKAHMDTAAIASIPLPGYTVAAPEPEDNIHQDYVFKLFHKESVNFYQVDDKNQLVKWFQVLEKVTKAELPVAVKPPMQENSEQSTL